MKSVVITGVSTGIGNATAKLLARKGWHVFGSVRKSADAERLSREIGTGFTPLRFDVTDRGAIQEAAAVTREALEGHSLAALVSNAGVVIPGPLLQMSSESFREQIEVNLIGSLTVIQAFAPLLGADRGLKGAPGRIVSVSSMCGKIGFPFLGAYSASKHALEGLSEALRRELAIYGIGVVVVEPGAVSTPIFDKGLSQDASRVMCDDFAASGRRFRNFVERDLLSRAITPDAAAQVICRALTDARPKLRYVAMSGNLVQWAASRVLPRRWQDQIIASQLGLSRLVTPNAPEAEL